MRIPDSHTPVNNAEALRPGATDAKTRGADPQWKAAVEFEAMFLNQLMKGMRQTVDHSEMSEPSPARETFTEMLDQQYAGLSAHSLANQGSRAAETAKLGTHHGLAAQIYRSMLRAQGSEATPAVMPTELHKGFPLGPRSPAAPMPLAPQADQSMRKLDEETLGILARQAGRKHGLPASLIRSVIQTESAGDSLAVSKSGAKGLMQLMDTTAGDLGVRDSFDPQANVDGGARYLKQLLNRFDGDLPKALAGYNAGPGAVEKHGGIPPYAETQGYVKNVIRRMGGYAETFGE